LPSSFHLLLLLLLLLLTGVGRADLARAGGGAA
jgi:hypothetical protein